MMRQMRSGGGVPGMPGMPGLGGAGGKKAKGRSGKAPAKPKKGRSGNPAKRALQESGTGRGLDDLLPGAAPAPTLDELPPEFRNLLGGS